MRAIIVANGDLDNTDTNQLSIHPDELIIAADGGARNCRSLGLIPKVVIGDFDSLDNEQLIGFQVDGAEIIKYPAHKDYTDLELAMLYALNREASQILIIGALGNRWDQTLANLLLPAGKAFSGIPIKLIDGPQEIQLIRSGHTLDLTGMPGDTVSLIPIAGSAAGITTQGLEYPLAHEPLHFGSTRGVSNTLLGNRASVALKKGLVLCILIHRNRSGTDVSPANR